MPNTTHISQETDRNYGLFKGLFRSNLQTLTAQLRREFDSSSDQGKKMPSVTRSHYPILLNGRPADPDHDLPSLEPAFAKGFTAQNNLRSWALCGAVPLTRVLLTHPQIRIDVDTDEPLFHQHQSLRKLQEENDKAVDALEDDGFNGKVFQKTVKMKPNKRISLAPTMTQVDKIKKLAYEGISVRNVQQIIGTGCLQADEVLQAVEYKKRLEVYEEQLKSVNIQVALKENEIKAKEYYEKKIFNATSYPVLIKWKIGPDEYKSRKVSQMKISSLRQTWEEVKSNVVDEIIVPMIEKPLVPKDVSETDLSKVQRINLERSIRSAHHLTSDELMAASMALSQLAKEKEEVISLNRGFEGIEKPDKL